MRKNYGLAFELTIGLEGPKSNDPQDPGGFTIWGLAQKYHPWITPQTTKEEAKKVYLNDYWIPSLCDQAAFPMDICLFDSAVNPQNDPDLPGSGNAEILAQNPENWQEFLLLRLVRYMKNSQKGYVKGHVFRVLKLFLQVRKAVRND